MIADGFQPFLSQTPAPAARIGLCCAHARRPRFLKCSVLYNVTVIRATTTLIHLKQGVGSINALLSTYLVLCCHQLVASIRVLTIHEWRACQIHHTVSLTALQAVVTRNPM